MKKVFPNGSERLEGPIKLRNETEDIPSENIPNYMNHFFIKVGDQGLKAELEGGEGGEWNLDIGEALDLESATQNRIDTLIKQINTSKSSGMGDIKTSALKDALTGLSHQVRDLVNTSIDTGAVPQGLKEAIVIPIPMQGDKKNVGNYRPISLLPVHSKILERVVHSQINSFLDEEEILSKFQHGFRKCHSTIQAVTELTINISSNMNIKCHTVALFIDFKKTFDCVQHHILLGKLKLAGFGENTK